MKQYRCVGGPLDGEMRELANARTVIWVWRDATTRVVDEIQDKASNPSPIRHFLGVGEPPPHELGSYRVATVRGRRVLRWRPVEDD